MDSASRPKTKYASSTTMEYFCPPYTRLEDLRATLDRKGYAVVKGVLSHQECSVARNMAREDFLELTVGGLDIEDPTTYPMWRRFMNSHNMLQQSFGIGHMKWLWYVRQNPNVVDAFARLWNCNKEDMICSFDATALHLPPEQIPGERGTGIGWYIGNDWMHTDQNPSRPGFECVQGWVNVFDTRENDATLVVYEGSHLLHKEFFDMKSEELGHDLKKIKVNYYYY